MRTDLLVDRLSQNLRPVRPRSIKREALLLLVLGAIELAAFLGMGFMRPDMPMAMEDAPPSGGSSPAWGSSPFLVRASRFCRPIRSDHRAVDSAGYWSASLVIFASGWLIDAAGDGVAELVRRLDWTQGLQCVWKMVVLSIPPAIALGVLIRRAAPTDRAGTALAAALSSAAWGAFVFVFACPSDDPLYIAVWYTVGCSIVTDTGTGGSAAAVAMVTTPLATLMPFAVIRISAAFTSPLTVRSSS